MDFESELSPRATQAAIALGDLQKAVRFSCLYPPGHQLCAQAAERVCGRLTQFLQRHGPLQLTVDPDGILLEGEPVLQDSGQRTDLAALLLQEGVGRLSLTPGLEPAEIDRLIGLLAAANAAAGTALLVHLGGLRAVPVLQELTQRRALLFKRRESQRLQTIASAVLEHYPRRELAPTKPRDVSPQLESEPAPPARDA